MKPQTAAPPALTLALLIGLGGPLRAQLPTISADRWNRAAMEWVELLRSQDFTKAGARVDPAVPDSALNAPALEQIWTQVSAQLGELTSLASGPVTESGVYHVVDLPATFADQALSIRVVLTDDLLVSGLFFRPAAPPAWEAPEYVDADSFTEIELAVGAEPWLLPAVLTVPTGDGPFPGIVLVHGSGPNDRDETIGGNRPFRDLAEGLSSRGVAVLRYDKRTYAHGARMTGDDVGLDEEVLDDAVRALSVLREQPRVDASRTYVLGHSLGGMLAPEIAVRDGGLAGVVILAGPARPMGEVIVDQLEWLAQNEAPGSAGRETLDALIAEARRFADGSTDDDPGATVLGVPVAYWRELETVDPVATAAADETPYLILQGGRDYQVTEADLDLWRTGLEGREAVEFDVYEDLNHLLGAGEGMATPAEYMSEIKPVDARVVDRIARWILRPPADRHAPGRLPEEQAHPR